MSGKLYGVGIGPGDPELLTLKAVRILQSAPVIAYLAANDGDSVARAIAAPHIPTGRIEIAMGTPMVAESRDPAANVYDHFSLAIAEHLREGRDVAVLCQGDPFFYGSFMYFFARLAPEHEVEIVPGVSSLTASAAAAGLPIASRDDVLAVLPATLEEAELVRRLEACEAAVIMKVGRHLDKVKRVLGAAGLLEGATFAARVGWPDQRIAPLAEIAGDAPYFSNVLVHRHGVGT